MSKGTMAKDTIDGSGNLGVAKNANQYGIQMIDLTLRGKEGSLLCIHRFAEKAKQEIRDKQQKKKVEKKGERFPNLEFEACKYLDDKHRECVPITAIKKALISAATAMADLTKVGLRQAIFVGVAGDKSAALCPIELFNGKPAVAVFDPVKSEDAVTIGINTRGLTYRPKYEEWQLRVTIEYNPRIVSEEQLLGLVDQAGWGVGICEGRPERSSALGWGRFERLAS
jgi:hypothetical protein